MPAAVVALLAVLTACASSGEGSARVDQNEVGFEELQAAGVSNAYDAVQRLRPAWLRSRGPRSTGIAQMETQIVVSLNGAYYGDVETLRQFPIDDVEALTYVDGTAAPNAVSGVGPGIHVEAAIVVRMRGR
ncbi:MAG: hypothetical protein WD056_01680 [Gemmatimonadota bacterium]